MYCNAMPMLAVAGNVRALYLYFYSYSYSYSTAPHSYARAPAAADAGVSLPRATLYAHYLRHCHEQRLDPMNPASFGKLIRSVFLGLRTRRLGTVASLPHYDVT